MSREEATGANSPTGKGAQQEPGSLLLLIRSEWPGTALPGRGFSAERLASFLERQGFKVCLAFSAAEAEQRLDRQAIAAAIIDLDHTDGALYRVYERMQSGGAPVPVLLLGSASPRPRKPKATTSSQRDEYLRLDNSFSLDYLLLRLRSVLRRTYPHWGAPLDDSSAATSSGEPGPGSGKLVCFYASKDGSGRTTVAANFAVGLAQLYRQRTVLVDADLTQGDVDIVLDIRPSALNPRRSLADLASLLGLPGEDRQDAFRRAQEGINGRLLDQILFRHASGLRILAAPEQPEQAARIPLTLLRRAITACCQAFDYTLVDLPALIQRTDDDPLTELEWDLLEASTSIVFVLKPERASLRASEQFMDEAVRHGWERKLLLVLNRADTSRLTGVTREEVEVRLGHSTLPICSSASVLQAATEGGVVLTRFPNSKVAEGFRRALGRLVAEECPRSRPQPSSVVVRWGRSVGAIS